MHTFFESGEARDFAGSVGAQLRFGFVSPGSLVTSPGREARLKSTGVNKEDSSTMMNDEIERESREDDAIRPEVSDICENLHSNDAVRLEVDGFGCLRVKFPAKFARSGSSLTRAEVEDALVPALKCNTLVETLDLSEVLRETPPSSFRSLVDGVVCSEHASLTRVLLCSNGLGNDHAVVLSHSLKRQYGSKLTELDLSCNKIGVEGARSLADGLRDNTTLQKLVLSGNAIASKGVGRSCPFCPLSTKLPMALLPRPPPQLPL